MSRLRALRVQFHAYPKFMLLTYPQNSKIDPLEPSILHFLLIYVHFALMCVYSVLFFGKESACPLPRFARGPSLSNLHLNSNVGVQKSKTLKHKMWDNAFAIPNEICVKTVKLKVVSNAGAMVALDKITEIWQSR